MPKKDPSKQRCRYVPTLTNEEINKIPVRPENSTTGRNIVLTEKGEKIVKRLKCQVWRNPFGE